MLIIMSYLSILLYWLSATFITESFIPNEASINAVEPQIPITVINNLFLYLNMFLKVILFRKLKLFQILSIFSRNILFPFLGASGLISSAGVLLVSLRKTSIVAKTVDKIEKTKENMA